MQLLDQQLPYQQQRLQQRHRRSRVSCTQQPSAHVGSGSHFLAIPQQAVDSLQPLAVPVAGSAESYATNATSLAQRNKRWKTNKSNRTSRGNSKKLPHL